MLAALRSWWAGPKAPLAVRTSGSTAAPRDVLLSHAALLASATAAQRRLGGRAAWVLALPVDFVAGLQVLVRSVVAGTEPVRLAAHGGDWSAARESAAAAARRSGADLCATALVPTQLQRLDRTGRLADLAGFDAVLLGGAAADPGLLNRAASAGVRVVSTYGLAETCGGCVYDGEPLDGVGVRVAADGRIQLAGPVLFDGYAGDPEGTAAVLVDGWLRTEDLGRLDDTGRLHVLGRADEVVLSGGVNVSLPAVEQALRAHPAVRDAAVVGLPDAEWGSRVVAVVQPESDGGVANSGAPPPTLAVLREHVTGSLPRSWAPRAVHTTSALPLLPSGKVDRLAVRAVAEAAGYREAP